ncbi:hypothetical protein F5148DRAFT_340783 [Russula earlei]|uniref:Uncharacterized protein n=1 Tax=Russula earlei TaxID=71964 RepID=A0ACC0U2I5_9AGAM|nr:hypothetical protein F5148DRAFT_340783 [Russula earlei]
MNRPFTSPTLDFFTSSSASFHPRPYQPNFSADPPPKPPPPARNNSLTHPLPPMDPSPAEPNTIFIHPPFFDFPDSHLYPDGLTYTVMAMNPDWFLDPADFISMHTSNPNAIPYPPQLEPPRGWCPAKKKDLKERGAEGWPDGEEPRLRCTFCRRTYAGVNAKSMWRRHVFEKHKIAMSNRRENADRSRKGSRVQEKENLSISKRTSLVDEASKSRLRSLRPAASASTSALSDRRNDNDSDIDTDLRPPSAPRVPQGEFPVLVPPVDPSRPPFSQADSRDSPTPPPNSPRSLSPEVAPRSREASPSLPLPVIPISPYNPLTTPSFRHSPPRLPSDQPWRFPSPSHPLHFTLDVSLGMVRPERASPSQTVSTSSSTIDVSPVIIAPRDGKASSFNTPGVVIFGKKDVGRSNMKPTPRRLFLSSSLPTPFTERLSLDRPRPAEESPQKHIGSRNTPRASKFAPTRTKMNASLVVSPSSLGEDPFGTLYGTMIESGKQFPGRTFATPLSSPYADSPVVRKRRYLSDDSLVKSTLNRELFSKERTIGLGLLEAFSLKQGVADMEDDCEIDSMLMSSPILRARPAVELDIEDRNEEGEDSGGLHQPVKKRRKTMGETSFDL